MEWWSFWLSTGFAMFMDYLCTDDLYPEFNLWTQFITNTLIPAIQVNKLSQSDK
jgi:puromycin-sensitive aminopeptidase